MPQEIEELRAMITADNSDFLKKSKQTEKAGASLSDLLISGAIKAGRILSTNIDLASKFGNEIAKSARSAGLSATEYQKLKAVSDRLGISVSALSGAVVEQNRAIKAGIRDQGFYKRALDELGISSEELAKKSPVERLLAQVKALQKIKNETRRAQLANDLFGGSEKALAPLLNTEAKLINETAEALKRKNQVSPEAVSQLEKFLNSLKEIDTQLQSISAQGAARFVEPINKLLEIPLRKLDQRNVNAPGGGPGGIKNILRLDDRDKQILEELKLIVSQALT